MADTTKPPSLFRNITSMIGALIAVIALANIIFLMVAEMTGEHHQSPYIGILAYVVVPSVLVFGLLLVFLGALLERRKRRRMAPGEYPVFPRIDLNDAHMRRRFFIFTIGGVFFVLLSVMGSYQAYEFTETTEFCGLLCHKVMHPEYIAYKASPHARVDCVECHVGPGATWYVKSKLSGAYQVYAATFNKYPKPILTPVANLRPAQQTCEQCHWPEKFWGAQMKVFNHYGYDEANTPRETRMLIKTGGGSPTSGITAGIHWHMNIANEVTYVASDRQRQKIPYVRLKDRAGKVTEFFAEDAKLTPQQIEAAPKRRMDCVDCHNRPSHIYVPPDRSVDRAMLAGRIDKSIPFIKQQAVTVLTKDYASTDQAKQEIPKALNAYYSANYPDVYARDRQKIDRAAATAVDIFTHTRFPEMKVDWRTHPDNIGHFYYTGCFRCHDDQHVSKDGKKITKDCNICHDILGQKEAGVAMIAEPEKQFQHPVELGDLREFNCSDCHTGAVAGE